MTIKGVLWRFALAYLLGTIAVGLIVNALGLSSGSGLNVGILAGCIIWVCGAFGKANGRYFDSEEKTRVVLGMIAIDVALQFIFTWAAMSQRPGGLNSNAMLFALAFVGVFHAVGIYVFVSMARKFAVKQGAA